MPGVDPSGETAVATGETVADASRSAAPARDSLVGRQLAHFRVERRLGRGGMGEVYLATDLALERSVALKVVAGGLASDPDTCKRFLREARAQARLVHPNVCHIYYVGEVDGLLFFAMEHIEGQSLQERLDQGGALSPGEAVDLCRQAALGLREAHRQGFIHRDVKPSNLMVDRNGLVKVVDFGLVKQTTAHDAAQAGLTLDRAAILGTPLYMAPEQARGEAVDFRADIYSLGATLHHLVAGKPPFAADTTMGVIARHLSDPRPSLAAGKKRRGLADLDELIDRMMAKRPEDRFASYDDLLAAMEQVSPHFTRPAGLWVRGFALALDFLVVSLVVAAIGALARVPDFVSFPLVAALYSIGAHGRWGRTLGKAALEITVVARGRAGPPGYLLATRRFFLQWGATIACLEAATHIRMPNAVAIVLGLAGVLAPLVLGLLSVWSRSTRVLYQRAPGTPAVSPPAGVA